MSKKASHIINLSSFILKISYAIARLNSEALFLLLQTRKCKSCAYSFDSNVVHTQKIFCLATKLKWILIRTIRHWPKKYYDLWKPINGSMDSIHLQLLTFREKPIFLSINPITFRLDYFFVVLDSFSSFVTSTQNHKFSAAAITFP